MTTTPLISAAVAGPAQEAPASPVPPQTTDSPAFRDVLATQSPSEKGGAAGKDGAKEPAPPGRPGSGNSASTGKPVQGGKKTDDKKSPAADNSTPAGPTLPSIALYIAAEANATLSHPAPDGDTQTANDSQKASTAGSVPSGGKPAGLPATPRGVTDATTFFDATAAVAADAGTGPAPSKPASAEGETLSGTRPGPSITHAPLRPAAGHGSTTTVAAVPANARAKTAGTHPASPSGAGPDTVSPHEAAGSARRTLARTASDSTPALLATTPATSTVSPNLSTASASATPAVSVPLQSPHWPGELGRQFVAIAQSSQPGQGHTAELRLDPPNLGPLHIAIHVSDNVAQAVFFSPHAQVRQAVENALPQLQQQLAQAGIALGQASVSDQGTPRQAFSGDAPTPRRRAPGTVAAAAMTADSPAMPQQARASATNALVDTFA